MKSIVRKVIFAGVALTLAAAAPSPPMHSAPISVEILAIPGVSSPMWESHPAEDPLTGDLWFVRSDEKFLGWRLWMAKCERGHFAQAVPSPIAAPGLEADPTFIDGGRRLLFISTRATGTNRSADLDIWMSRRLKSGWSAPVRLPAPINSDKAEWFPRKAPDGWLYFGSARHGGEGGTDIWRVRQRHGEAWSIENLGPSVNTADHEYEFAILPGGRTAILATEQGLYPVIKHHGVWQRGEKFDPQINQNGTEIGPVPIGLDGDFLISRDVGLGRSGELLAIRRGGSNGPPLRCPRGLGSASQRSMH